MLKRTRDTVRAVAEAVGAITPNLAEATEAAEIHQRNLIAAQSAREAAEQALQSGHDRNADDAEVVRLEAALAAAKVTESRAEARYRGAQSRLAKAQAAEAERTRAAAIAKRDDVLAIRARAAANIDRLAAEIAEQAATYDAQAGPLAECSREGVTGQYISTSGRSLIEAAIRRAVAEEAGAWTGDKPPAAELAEQVRGAVLS